MHYFADRDAGPLHPADKSIKRPDLYWAWDDVEHQGWWVTEAGTIWQKSGITPTQSIVIHWLEIEHLPGIIWDEDLMIDDCF